MTRLYDLIKKQDSGGCRLMNIAVGFQAPQGISWNPPAPVAKKPMSYPTFSVPMNPPMNWSPQRVVQGSMMWLGIKDWIPAVAPVPGQDNYCGVDRSQDPYRLAGLRAAVSSGDTLDRALAFCFQQLWSNGAAATTVVMPDKYSHKADEFVKVLQNVGSQFNAGMKVNWKWNLCFEEYDGDPFILQADTWTLYRQWDEECGTWIMGNLACEAPGYNLRMLGSDFS